jgi:bacteriorhodopsin
MVVQEQTLYAGGAAIIFAATVVSSLLVTKFEGDIRKHMLAMPVVLGVLTLGYVGMALEVFVATSPEGEPVYFTRYASYIITYTYLMAYIGLLAGARRRYRLVPAVSVIGFSLGTPITQLTSPPVDSVGSLIVIASLVLVFWAFFGPLARAAASESGDRRLLFVKIRNLSSLLFIMYLLVALTNRAALGLLDAFVGIFTIAYVDLIGHIVFAGLIIFSGSAIEMLVSEYPSPLATFTNGDS